MPAQKAEAEPPEAHFIPASHTRTAFGEFRPHPGRHVTLADTLQRRMYSRSSVKEQSDRSATRLRTAQVLQSVHSDRHCRLRSARRRLIRVPPPSGRLKPANTAGFNRNLSKLFLPAGGGGDRMDARLGENSAHEDASPLEHAGQLGVRETLKAKADAQQQKRPALPPPNQPNQLKQRHRRHRQQRHGGIAQRRPETGHGQLRFRPGHPGRTL